MKAIVNLQMSTIGYSALQAYLKWSADLITTEDFQGALNTLGYKLDMCRSQDEVSLVKNLLTEVE